MVKKIAKFQFFVLSFFAFMVITNADSCAAPIVDKQTNNVRVLSCDVEKQTVTKFEFGKDETEEIFKNDYCTIKCSENMVLAVDPIKKVKAGMGFNYPLIVSSQRVCNASYDYEVFDNRLRNLVTSRNSFAVGSVNYRSLTNQIGSMLNQKKECETFGDKSVKDAKGIYEIKAEMSLVIETSEGETTEPYIFKETSPYKITVEKVEILRKSCHLDNENSTSCKEVMTESGHRQWARIDGIYTMTDKYIELYTGKVLTTPLEDGKSCPAGGIFYTSFYEKTRPVAGDPTDKGYKLTLRANKLGNNLSDKEPIWSLVTNCNYELQNLIFPQPGDANYNNKSKLYEYRTIALDDPFPSREARDNWKGKEGTIPKQAEDVKNKAAFKINLNSPIISSIREYNERNSYVPFEMFVNSQDKERSKFVEDNVWFIQRK